MGCPENVRWHFSPAQTPHFGGLWEAAVKWMKMCLRKVLGQQKLLLSEMMTVVTSAEVSINSRPLAAIEAMVDDGVEPLTPYHFTTGRAPASLITDTTLRYNISINNRWNLVQQLRNQLWKCYFTEYVTLLKQHLPQRFKNSRKTNLKVRDIVLVKDQVLFQHCWPMAQVTKVHPGMDRVMRAVTIGCTDMPTAEQPGIWFLW